MPGCGVARAAKAFTPTRNEKRYIPCEKEGSLMDIQAEIRQFLARFFKDYDLKDDEDIFSLGFVNSLFAMQLVLFVERTFQITIENQDLDIDNFRTINALTSLIKRKTATLA